MRRAARIWKNDTLVGLLHENADGSFTFTYDEMYYHNRDEPPVSLTMPKTQAVYHSPVLFPVFYHMLAEGVNRKLQLRHLRIDEDDDFGLFLATVNKNSIGALHVVTVTYD